MAVVVTAVTEATVATVRADTEDGMLVARARRAVPLVNLLLSCEFYPVLSKHRNILCVTLELN